MYHAAKNAMTWNFLKTVTDFRALKKAPWYILHKKCSTRTKGLAITNAHFHKGCWDNRHDNMAPRLVIFLITVCIEWIIIMHTLLKPTTHVLSLDSTNANLWLRLTATNLVELLLLQHTWNFTNNDIIVFTPPRLPFQILFSRSQFSWSVAWYYTWISYSAFDFITWSHDFGSLL